MLRIAQLLLIGAARVGAQGTACEFTALPDRVVEGRPFEVTAKYAVAQGEARLNCELKDPTNVVLQGERQVVRGAGEVTFSLTAPRFAETREILIALWLGEDWRQPLAPIVHTGPIRVVTQAVADQWDSLEAQAPQVLEQAGWRRSEAGNVAVLCDEMPGLDRAVAERYAAALAEAGMAVTRLTGEQLANPYVLGSERFDVLVLPHAQSFPAVAVEALNAYLRQGGDLAAVGAPAFSRLLTKIDGEWLDKEQYLDRLARTPPDRIVLDFDGDQPPPHARASDRPDLGCTVETTAPGAADSPAALRVQIANLHGWDTLGFDVPPGAFEPGATLTCFWAKGGPRTTQLSLEWRETDGSRWIAVVPLTREWKAYALRPSDFKYWHDSASQGRGTSGDALNPANVAHLSLGLAMTHTAVPGGEHEYWIDQLGSAVDPLADQPEFALVDTPIIDSVSPGYKLYPNRNAKTLDSSAGRGLLGDAALPMPDTPLSCHPRPQGTGFGKARKWRWVPLVQVRGEDGEVSGTLATLTLNAAGSLVASITAGEAAYTARDEVIGATTKLVQRMLRGVFLYEGGAEHYAYFEGEPIRIGAKVVNEGRVPAVPLTVEIAVKPQGGGDPLLTRTFPVEVAPGAEAVIEAVRERGATAGSEYEVTTRLLADGEVIDELRHPLLIWRPKSEPQYITARDGDFWEGNRKWYPYGVNYMPSSECGIEDGEYFEYWLDPQPYDPEVTERDLERIAAMGMNMVSVFVYYRSIDSGNLLDLLMRCERHGLKVNLSLRPGTPLDFQWPQMGEIIRRYRIAEMDNVFVYDLAWEPVFGGYDARKRWDPQWAEWVVERYGSLENAERDWGMPIPRADGAPTGPSDQQVSTDGEWRVMVAAYRRFVDDLLSQAHLRAAQKVKSVDPNHLISFRMNIAGDPTAGAAAMAYDFGALAKSVDVMEPEGYGRIGDWDRVVPGWFTAAYSRYAAPGRPVMWAEFGCSVWDQARMTQDEGRLAFAAQFYRDFLTMSLKSGAGGAVCWFYPGGYRYNERSDYGIINPDGTWREVTSVLHEFSAPMTAGRGPYWPDVQLRVDRDADARGMQGIWAAVGGEFLAAIEAGKRPALAPAAGPGSSSADPVIAVGNRPYGGSNPPKYLNAEFNRFEVQDAEGRWVAIEQDGQEVNVAAGKPVPMRASVGNTGRAKWLWRSGPGRVFLASTEDSPVTVRALPAEEDVPPLGDATFNVFGVLWQGGERTTLTFEMLADGRARFGEKLTVVLVPE
ncbi:MAG: hypothetical protein FJX74_05280 [Armatimonadetes bacterium]|nr:hypothetical protein [Armatimonadota bacterium]